MVKTFKVYLGQSIEPFLLHNIDVKGNLNKTKSHSGYNSSICRSRTNSSRSNCLSTHDFLNIPSTSPTSSHMNDPFIFQNQLSSNLQDSVSNVEINSNSTTHLIDVPVSSNSIASDTPSNSASPNSPCYSGFVSPQPQSPQNFFDMIKYSCVHCQANLARHEDLISKSFQGSQGRAYLFQNVVNIKCSPAEERLLLTGLHSVCDISCACCNTVLGWKYEHAYEPSQKYKEGKYIIELTHLMKDNCWEADSIQSDHPLNFNLSPTNFKSNSYFD